MDVVSSQSRWFCVDWGAQKLYYKQNDLAEYKKLEEGITITVPFPFTMYPHIATQTYIFIFTCQST